jgi:acyl-CoA synthetase (AMP-forming)/AMP-acid ligase II
VSTPLSQRILETLTATGDAIAVEALDSIWTGADARREIESWASRFRSLDLVAGTPVGLSLPSGPALLFSCVAGLHLGLHLAYFNPELGRSDLRLQMAQVEPCVHIVRDQDVMSTEVPTVTLGQLAEQTPSGLADAQPGGELIGFTSGTSGPPKAVRHLADRLHTRFMAFQSVFQLERDHTMVCVLPTYLLASLTTSSLYGLWIGTRVAILPRFHLDDFEEVVSKHGCDYLMAVPAIYREILARRPELAASMRDSEWLLCGAAPLDAKTQQAWADAGGAPLSTCYGSTEAGGFISVDSTRGRAPVGSVGRPMPDVGLSITTPDGRELAPGEEGEIRLRRASIFWSYARAEPGNNPAHFATGDRGHLDTDGFLFHGGRSSDIINRGGFKIVPGQIEECLMNMPLVEACAVVAGPDDRLGEVPVAFVESRASITCSMVKECLAGQLTPYKIPVQVRCVLPGHLPRGAYGKWDRKEMRRIAQDWKQWGRNPI